MKNSQITEILNKDKIDSDTWNQVLPIVYHQLKKIARNVKFGHKKQDNLNTTSLVHEAFIKIQNHNKLSINGTKHFYLLAAKAMRQILVDSARANLASKRTPDESTNSEEDFILKINDQITSADQLLEIDQTLNKLEKLNSQLSDIVINHFYGGYTFKQISEMSDVSERTVIRNWKKAKAYIYSQVS